VAGVAVPLSAKALDHLATRLERAEGKTVLSRGLRATSKVVGRRGAKQTGKQTGKNPTGSAAAPPASPSRRPR
jgi:hypothetical protein